MKGICPMCGHAANIFAFADEAEAKAFSRLAFKMPAALGDPVMDYLRLFSPPKRALQWKRARVLVQELHEAIERGSVHRNGREWAAPLPAWKPALQAVIAKRDELTLPLKDHAYLFTILANQQNSEEARAENKREAQRRARQPSTNPTPTEPEAPRMTLPPGGIMAGVREATARMRTENNDPES